MFFAGLKVELPARDLGAQILFLIVLDEPVTNVGYIHLLPTELLGPRFEIGFHIVEQLANVDLVGDELNALGVAEAEIDRGAATSRLRHDGFELTPVTDDLIEPLLA